MKYGVREICDVVLRAKSTQKVGNKIFYKHEPVIYFDTLKTSSLEGAATTVYAQGGRGNSRLMAWEGERTVTFNMEDALISPAGFMILSGAGLIEATDTKPIITHTTETTKSITVDESGSIKITLAEAPYYKKATSTETQEDWIYVMLLENGEVVSEPYIAKPTDTEDGNVIELVRSAEAAKAKDEWGTAFESEKAVLVDYYVERKAGVAQIEITPDKFGGNYYLEASTLFRDTNGADKPAEFIIPNCKIQSNFTFTMASSGDPSSFNFVMDAFPDFTRFDDTKKVLAAIQIIDEAAAGGKEVTRLATQSNHEYNEVTGQFEVKSTNS